MPFNVSGKVRGSRPNNFLNSSFEKFLFSKSRSSSLAVIEGTPGISLVNLARIFIGSEGKKITLVFLPADEAQVSIKFL